MIFLLVTGVCFEIFILLAFFPVVNHSCHGACEPECGVLNMFFMAWSKCADVSFHLTDATLINAAT